MSSAAAATEDCRNFLNQARVGDGSKAEINFWDGSPYFQRLRGINKITGVCAIHAAIAGGINWVALSALRASWLVRTWAWEWRWA